MKSGCDLGAVSLLCITEVISAFAEFFEDFVVGYGFANHGSNLILLIKGA